MPDKTLDTHEHPAPNPYHPEGAWPCCSGSYARTTPDPDDMDGGVTAALIEKEAAARVCCGPLDEDVAFWHARWHEAADQRDARDAAAHLWKETARNAIRTAHGIGWERDQYRAGEEEAEGRAEKAEKALAVTTEDRDRVLDLVKDADMHRDLAVERAEKAERERDEARATKDMHKRRADEERARADAAESRPLTPDAITDGARDRAYRAVAALSVSDWDDMSGVAKGRAIALVEAVITEITRPEPPARPEGAEEWEDWLIRNLDHESLTDQQIEDLANRIARRDEEKR